MEDLLTSAESLYKRIVSKGLEIRKYGFETKSPSVKLLLSFTPELSLCCIAGQKLNYDSMEKIATEMGMPWLYELRVVLNQLDNLLMDSIQKIEQFSHEVEVGVTGIKALSTKLIGELDKSQLAD